MTVWQNRMFCGCLVGRPYPLATRKTQLSPSVLTLRIPVMCRAHASFHGMLSHELPVKTLMSSIAWVFTHSLSITQPLQLNPIINKGYKRLNKITIKFGVELIKANKTHSCKLQLYNLPLWLFRDKTPKTDSRLKCEFGYSGKTH